MKNETMKNQVLRTCVVKEELLSIAGERREIKNSVAE